MQICLSIYLQLIISFINIMWLVIKANWYQWWSYHKLFWVKIQSTDIIVMWLSFLPFSLSLLLSLSLSLSIYLSIYVCMFVFFWVFYHKHSIILFAGYSIIKMIHSLKPLSFYLNGFPEGLKSETLCSKM